MPLGWKQTCEVYLGAMSDNVDNLLVTNVLTYFRTVIFSNLLLRFGSYQRNPSHADKSFLFN